MTQQEAQLPLRKQGNSYVYFVRLRQNAIFKNLFFLFRFWHNTADLLDSVDRGNSDVLVLLDLRAGTGPLSIRSIMRSFSEGFGSPLAWMMLPLRGFHRTSLAGNNTFAVEAAVPLLRMLSVAYHRVRFSDRSCSSSTQLIWHGSSPMMVCRCTFMQMTVRFMAPSA